MDTGKELSPGPADTSSVTVCPGQRLAEATKAVAGQGTFVRDGWIYASLVGTRSIAKGKGNVSDTTPIIEVVSRKQNTGLEVGSYVACKVLSINPKYAKVKIIILFSEDQGRIPLRNSYRGMIRVQDVKATEKDQVVLYESFRPGDVVTARVISLGDAQSYYLTTAEDTLGVVYAENDRGEALIPVSWTEMSCERSGSKERRKVAAPGVGGHL